MNVHVDLERCTGTGNCVVSAPRVFDLADDAEHVRLLVSEVPPGEEGAVETAIRMCPQGALSSTG